MIKPLTSTVTYDHNGLIFPNKIIDSTILPLNIDLDNQTYFIPLLGYQQKIATPIVAVGEQVIKGQPIAQIPAIYPLQIHTPVSGIITAIKDQTTTRNPLHNEQPVIVIKAHKTNTEYRLPALELSSCTIEALAKRLADTGIVGLGGGGFFASDKILVAADSTIHTLIINGVECEPLLHADQAVIYHYTQEIIHSALFIQSILRIQDIKFVIQKRQSLLWYHLNQTLSQLNIKSIKIDRVPNRYPAGDSRQLIYFLSGIKIPQHQRTLSYGYLCFNVATLYAMAQALFQGKALTEKIVTLTGERVNTPGNYLIPIGLPIAELFKKYVTHFDTQPIAVLHGGIMMGEPLKAPWQTPVQKLTHCVVVNHLDDQKEQQSKACIRCGFCAKVCPRDLQPQQLYSHALSSNYSRLEQERLNDCIHCKACESVCPSRIPLVSVYQQAQYKLNTIKQEKQHALLAKTRYEARNKRLNDAKDRMKAQGEALLATLQYTNSSQQKLHVDQPTITNAIQATKNQTSPKRLLSAAKMRLKATENALTLAKKKGQNTEQLLYNIDQLKIEITNLEKVIHEL